MVVLYTSSWYFGFDHVSWLCTLNALFSDVSDSLQTAIFKARTVEIIRLTLQCFKQLFKCRPI